MHITLADLHWGGHHTPYVVYLSSHFLDEGHDVAFITDEANPRLEELPDSNHLNVRTVKFPRWPDNFGEGLFESIREQHTRVKQLGEIFQIAENLDTDILHLLYFDGTQVPLWLASRNWNENLPPIVGTLHRDAFLDNSERTLPKVATQAVTRFALNATLRDGTLDVLTIHANSIRDRIIGAIPAATRENVVTIPAPTPEISVDISQSEAREYLNLPQDRTVFLFFGGLRYEKGPDVLANALREVDREITVVYAGSEVDFSQSDVDRWSRQTPECVEIDDRLRFIPEDDVDYYFVGSDAVVLPYRRKRGISGPLRRAAMSSAPIIGNSNSDIGDIIESEGIGRTFNEESDLTRILADC